MKTLFNILLLSAVSICNHAQPKILGATAKKELPDVHIADDVALHFISPEPIQLVDISTNNVVGDLPAENILRVKYFPDTAQGNGFGSGQGSETVVTIVGQSFIAQYNVVYAPDGITSNAITSVEIQPDYMRPLEFPEITLTNLEMKGYALDVLKHRRTYNNVASRANGMTAWLNNIFSFGDYIFLDVSFHNGTRIKYDIDQFRFRIKDKRIMKATNVQEVEIEPVFMLYKHPYFRRSYRNVFVFRKFTFPDYKVFSVLLSEKQVSGRAIELKIDYRDLLNADTL